MDIISSNFQENLSLLLRSIEEADFIALDTEFTGFSKSQSSRYSYYDSIEDRYQKLKLNSNSFWVCQLGLCTFKKVESEYIARPFNVYLLPLSKNRSISIEYSNMRFLSAHGFDFNKLFKEGLHCCRLLEIEANMKPSFKDFPTRVLSEDTLGILQDYECKIREFLASTDTATALNVPNQYLKNVLSKEGALKRLRNVDVLWQETTDSITLVLKKLKKKNGFIDEEEAEKNIETPEETYARVLGFTIVFSTILKCQKPMIGHNYFLDLAMFYNHFIGELPHNLSTYKTSVTELFPDIYDTKLLSEVLKNNQVVDRTDLEGLYRQFKHNKDLSSEIRVSIPPEFTDYFQESRAHEAGFDAFMTGFVYLNLVNYLLRTNEFSSVSEVEDAYRNKICLVNHSKRFLDFNDKDEADVIFDNVVKVQMNEPREINEFAAICSQYGDVSVMQNNAKEFIVKFEYIKNSQSLPIVIFSLRNALALGENQVVAL